MSCLFESNRPRSGSGLLGNSFSEKALGVSSDRQRPTTYFFVHQRYLDGIVWLFSIRIRYSISRRCTGGWLRNHVSI